MSKVPDRTLKLPAARLLCYKPYMRKWMRDRLKRRKKPEETKPAEPGQAPLQPAYFDSSETPGAEPEAAMEAEAAPPPEPQEAAGEAGAGERPTSAEDAGPRRRRRGRGGRGRGGKRTGRPTAAPVSPGEAPTTVAQAGEAPAAPPPATATPAELIPVAPPRPPKGAVILAIGLPGSGKSSWFKRNNITPLSSDVLRMLLFDDAQE